MIPNLWLRKTYAMFLQEKSWKVPEDYSSFWIHHRKGSAAIAELGVWV